MKKMKTISDFIPSGEVIYKEMNGEQKLKVIIESYFDTNPSINRQSMMVLCLMAYYLGKSEKETGK